MTPTASAEHYAEAEKTAEELMRHRPSLYISLLENCSPSCPHGNSEKLLAEIAKAREANEKAKQRK